MSTRKMERVRFIAGWTLPCNECKGLVLGYLFDRLEFFPFAGLAGTGERRNINVPTAVFFVCPGEGVVGLSLGIPGRGGLTGASFEEYKGRNVLIPTGILAYEGLS